MGHSYYSRIGHCPGFTGSGGKSLRPLELRAGCASIHSIAGKRSSRKLIFTILHESAPRMLHELLYGPLVSTANHNM